MNAHVHLAFYIVAAICFLLAASGKIAYPMEAIGLFFLSLALMPI